ncbi:DUF6356 family protein [Novosphingobium sp.]|uniref:DUF6356 family protein n=1 Tax=Novosphingobium sp. TaxID=1874826 RepID=UPI002B46C6B4|nr:DUF6356 family protein [Novosphingobium sp.]HKR92358.1 DUF6356 family protein [Novosphingobium sp.]
MFDRLFRDHPRSVGETYFEHLRKASGFAGTMLVAGAACLVHAVIPSLFVRTASKTVMRLHDRMVANRTVSSSGRAAPPARRG